MKSILYLFIILSLLLSTSMLGAIKEEVIREDFFQGEKVFFCYDGNSTHYVRNESHIILAWKWARGPFAGSYSASYCYFGETQIYINRSYIMAAARYDGSTNNIQKIDKISMSQLLKIPIATATQQELNHLSEASERLFKPVKLDLPKGSFQKPIIWYFSIKEGALAASCYSRSKGFLEEMGIKGLEYYLYDERENKFIPKYKPNDALPETAVNSASPASARSDCSRQNSTANVSGRFPFLLVFIGFLLGGFFLWRRLRSRRK